MSKKENSNPDNPDSGNKVDKTTESDSVDFNAEREGNKISGIDTNSAPDPFDPKSLALKGNPAEAIGVKKALVHLPVRKPNNQEFFRVNSDSAFSMPMAILELKSEGETYLVTPAVAAAIPEEVRPVMLSTCISRQGTLFLWPVPIPSPDGRQNSWHITAREAAELSKTKWVRMTANMAAGAYQVVTPIGEIPEPDWPEHSFAESLRVAFGNGKLIDRPDHPVLQQLQGRM